jgi:hypothetical protein
MKKLIMVCILLIVVLLSGCGGGGDSTKPIDDSLLIDTMQTLATAMQQSQSGIYANHCMFPMTYIVEGTETTVDRQTFVKNIEDFWVEINRRTYDLNHTSFFYDGPEATVTGVEHYTLEKPLNGESDLYYNMTLKFHWDGSNWYAYYRETEKTSAQ